MRHVVDKSPERDASPVSEPVLLILLSLAETPRHGYALMKDIGIISSGRARLSTGTLYGALHRLLKNGCIERLEGGDTSRDKRFYRLTAEGEKVLAAEFHRMKHLTKLAGKRLSMREA